MSFSSCSICLPRVTTEVSSANMTSRSVVRRSSVAEVVVSVVVGGSGW